MSHVELPEHQIFHILKLGTEEPIGPYSQDQLVELLNQGEIKAHDYVYYPELSGWKRLSQVFEVHEQITNFADDGQDPSMVAETFTFMNDRSEPDESVYYIAVQQLPALSLTAAVRLTSPKSLVVTDHRICILNPKMMGNIELEEIPIEQVANAVKKIKAGDELGIFNIVLKNGEWVEVNKLPQQQLEKLEQLANELIR